jgi:curli biogenesis system outer membrane secretion channel CsgG
MRIKIIPIAIVTLACFFFSGSYSLAGSCKANEKDFTYTPISNTGQYVIAAPPGSVTGQHPIKVVTLDKDTAEKTEALVKPDGSFSIIVDAVQGDKIKLTFTDATGSKTSERVRMPIMSQKSMLEGGAKTVNAKGETPGGPAGMRRGAVSLGRKSRNAPELKKIVAVAEFKNRANVSSSWNLGTGMQAQLINALKRSGRFIVREQELLKDVFGEQDLAQSGRMATSKSAQIGKALTAQYLVRGTVTEFDAREVTDNKGFSIYGVSIKGGKSRAHMAVIIDLIDTTSGTIFASKRMEGKAEGHGAGGGLSVPYMPGSLSLGKQKHTPVNKAMQMCIDNAVYFITEELDKLPWQSTIVKASPEEIIIKGGEDDGIQPGYEFNVYRRGEELRDPDTGELLDVETKKIGTISVTKTKGKIAYAAPLFGKDFERGDIVKFE